MKRLQRMQRRNSFIAMTRAQDWRYGMCVASVASVALVEIQLTKSWALRAGKNRVVPCRAWNLTGRI